RFTTSIGVTSTKKSSTPSNRPDATAAPDSTPRLTPRRSLGFADSLRLNKTTQDFQRRDFQRSPRL
ncbi:MAG: hypothetical protein IJ387_10075, partial [Thermoguttaceae bacterium]|nr:hypothetical protein [Thermoguttaceae bacterium]